MGSKAPLRDASTPPPPAPSPAEIPFQALLDAAPDAIVIVDAAGRIVVVNSQAERLFGYRRAELIGQPVELLLPEEQRAAHAQHRRAYLDAPRTRPMGSGIELAARRKDGGRLPVEISLSPLETAAGPLIISSLRDVSERRQAEQARQRALTARLTSAEAALLQGARMAAVGQLAASVAHEINNPLYAVRNCLYLLEEDLPPELRSSEYLALARDQLERIARIIERMRDFYRPPRGEMAPHDLNRLLEDTLALVSLQMRHSAVAVVFAPAAGLPDLVCHGDQLRQVFLNLMLNAVEAMPAGGTLTVRTIAGPDAAAVEIADTGVGIPADIRARLFEAFFTTKPTGTGLGLSICAHIVTQHGGQLDVESRPGEGSTFRVVLPLGPDR